MKKNFKRAFAFLMIPCMLLATACSKESTDPTVPAPDVQDPTLAPTEGNSEAGSTEQTPVVDNATYTYNYAMSVFPTNWNPHTYQTATDAEILDYTSVGFYTFDYNENLDGYKIVPEMATAEPVDVTAEYAAQFGIGADETARAWKIALRNDLKWEDGTAITAKDFVKSAELLLNPVAVNYRADSLYSGSLAIVNAKNYLYQGQHAYSNTLISENYGDDEYIAYDGFGVADDGTYYVGDPDNDIAFYLSDGGVWSSKYGMQDYVDSYGADMFAKDGVDLWNTVVVAAADDEGQVLVTKEVYDALSHMIAVLHGYASVEDYAAVAGDYAYLEVQEFLYKGATYGEMDFSEVGVIATENNELVIVLEKPLEGFYLLYNLTSTWLVNETVYTSCEKVTDGVYTNSYGTSAKTFMSYGPYKLVNFQTDKEFTLTKNENYFGHAEGLYQTTDIKVTLVEEASTRLEYLLKGELDGYGLTAEDMETYAASDYTYYTTSDSTFFVALNPDFEALKANEEALGENYNKTILTIKEFRMALSFALDRTKFALAVSPTNNPAFGVYSSFIVANPETGETYREQEEAKWVLAKFWGLADEIGAGKMYETVDEAVDSITGYNLEQAKILFDQAYDMAIEQGLMDEDDVVSIEIGIPTATSTTYNNGNKFLVDCYTEAVKGTKLENKLEFTLDNTLGNGFADALRDNSVDFLFFVGWTGSALDPYGLMEAYTGTEYQYDPAWNTEEAMLDIELDGTVYTASVWDWTIAISGQPITITDAEGNASEFKAGSSDGNAEERFAILVALEGAVLDTYDMIPLVDDSSASLKGMQIEFYTEDYIYGVGRGSVKYMTYNYTDAEWDAYVAEQGGTLNYN